MKKIITLAVILTLLIASPAAATRILIDKNLHSINYEIETINKGGRLFVPVRFVSENLGYTVDWQNEQVVIKYVPHQPRIDGSDIFKAQIQAALDLLAQKDPLDYRMICDNVNWIERSDKIDGFAETSGNRAIIIGEKFINDPSYNTVNLAGALVHEATHDALYMICVFDHKENERQAYAREIAALKVLGAEQKYIKLIDQLYDKYNNQ